MEAPYEQFKISAMKSSSLLALFVVCSMGSQLSNAGDASPGKRTAEGSNLAGASMCANTDQVVFSCPLHDGRKVVSLCAVGDVNHGQGRFYYAYGRPSSPEMVFPSSSHPTDNPFTQSHLVYGGATGGTAYSFVNGGYKYIIYSVSGSDVNDGGVIVQRIAESRAMRDMKCQKGKIIESEDDSLINATTKWKSDPDIESHGLPTVN